MKKFKRFKTYEEIKAQCAEQGLLFDDRLYRERHFDTVVVRSAEGSKDYVIYNTTNGRFFGETGEGDRINSDSTRHDKEPWMQALLDFFLVEKDPTPVTLAQQIFEADERYRDHAAGVISFLEDNTGG